jgi:hypothetical protein
VNTLFTAIALVHFQTTHVVFRPSSLVWGFAHQTYHRATPPLIAVPA